MFPAHSFQLIVCKTGLTNTLDGNTHGCPPKKTEAKAYSFSMSISGKTWPGPYLNEWRDSQHVMILSFVVLFWNCALVCLHLLFSCSCVFVPSSQCFSIPSLTCSFPASVHLFPVPLVSLYGLCSPSMSLSVHSVLFYSVFICVRRCRCSVFPAVSPPVCPHVSSWYVSGFCFFCFYIDFYFVAL